MEQKTTGSGPHHDMLVVDRKSLPDDYKKESGKIDEEQEKTYKNGGKQSDDKPVKKIGGE